jgi:hypothetical protein
MCILAASRKEVQMRATSRVHEGVLAAVAASRGAAMSLNAGGAAAAPSPAAV